MSDSGAKKSAPSLLAPLDGDLADLDDLRPSPDHEDDHSDPGFDLAAELEAAPRPAPESPAPEPDQESAEALFPEFVRPCLDHEDDHSDADIDLDAEIKRQLGEETPPEMRALEDSDDVHPGLRAALSASYAFAVKGLAPDEDQGAAGQADGGARSSEGSGAPDSRNLEGLGVDDDSRYAQEPEDSGDDDLPPLQTDGARSAADGAVAGAAGSQAAAGSLAAAGADGDDGCADDDDPYEDGDDEDDGEGDDDDDDEDEDEDDDEDEDEADEEDGEDRRAKADSGPSRLLGQSWRVLRLLLSLLLLGLLLGLLFSERISPFLPRSVQDFMASTGLISQPPGAALPAEKAPGAALPGAQPQSGQAAEQAAKEPGASAIEPGNAPAGEPGAPPAKEPGAKPFGFAAMAQLLPVIFFAAAFLFIICRVLAGEKKIRSLSVKDYQAAARGSAASVPAKAEARGQMRSGGQGGAQSRSTPASDGGGDDDDGADDQPMSFADHFRELRKRFFRVFLLLLAGFCICWPFAEELFSLLTLPLLVNMPKGSTFIFTSPPEAFFTYMKIALVAGFFTASPLIFYQVWAFVAPGLYKEEKLYILPIAFFSAFFFIGGGAFCYYVVFPFAFEFFMSYNTGIIQAMPALSETLSFVLKLLIAFGLIFEMPLFAFFLGRMGLLTAGVLRRFRRYAVLVLFIVAALLTPPDVVSQLLMAGPLLLLYEVSILIVAAVGKKETVDEEEDEEEDDEEEDEEEEGGASAGASS